MKEQRSEPKPRASRSAGAARASLDPALDAPVPGERGVAIGRIGEDHVVSGGDARAFLRSNRRSGWSLADPPDASRSISSVSAATSRAAGDSAIDLSPASRPDCAASARTTRCCRGALGARADRGRRGCKFMGYDGARTPQRLSAKAGDELQPIDAAPLWTASAWAAEPAIERWLRRDQHQIGGERRGGAYEAGDTRRSVDDDVDRRRGRFRCLASRCVPCGPTVPEQSRQALHACAAVTSRAPNPAGRHQKCDALSAPPVLRRDAARQRSLADAALLVKEER